MTKVHTTNLLLLLLAKYARHSDLSVKKNVDFDEGGKSACSESDRD